MNRREVLTLAVATLVLHSVATARPVSPLLRITGQIRKINNSQFRSFDFSEAAFMRLPAISITTSTPWTPRSTFSGPLLQTVMSEAGVSSGTLNCKTLDDRSTPIPWDDLARFGVILAHSQNGQRLSNKRWGPLWTMYPRDTYPEALNGPIAESRFIWQVDRIEAGG